MWRDQLAALRRAGVDALAVDLPGHGARRGEAFTLDGAVEAVAAGIDDVGGRALVTDGPTVGEGGAARPRVGARRTVAR